MVSLVRIISMGESNKIQKVVAYITTGNKLLVFRHTDYPEAGIQVPGGSMDAGESPTQAVLREAIEETGLVGLEIQAYLGDQILNLDLSGKRQVLQRHYYHLVLNSEVPDSWRHFEISPSDGSPESIEFEFFWVELPDKVPELSGELGIYLGQLRNHLHRRQQ